MNKPLPILFRTRTEVESRPNFVRALTCGENDLDYIVGKYPFNAEDEVQCGVNRCNNWHQKGYLIAIKSGQETYLGHVCGRTEFGFDWIELAAAVDRGIEEVQRAEKLRKTQNESLEILQRCSQLMGECTQLVEKISAVITEISRDTPFKTLFELVIKDDGKIKQQVQTSTGKFITEVKETLNGTYSIAARKSVIRELKNNVESPLTDLKGLQLSLLSPTQVQDWTTKLLNVNSTFILAEKFQKEATVFLSKTNLNKFEKLHKTLPKAKQITRTKSIVANINKLS